MTIFAAFNSSLRSQKSEVRIFVLCLLSSVLCPLSAQETSIPWHVKDARLRFRIEKDYTHSLIPNVSLLDIEADKKSAGVKSWIEKNRWIDKRQIDGKLCQNFLPSFGTKPILYNLHREFVHFVAKAAIVDNADPNVSVSFEVHADTRRLFRSGPLTKQGPLAEINVGIPVRSKQLKLVTKASNNQHYRWAKWVDPGFMLRGKYPAVSSVRIYTPGYNPEDLVPEVFVTNSGSRVNSQILFARQGEPMDILFASPKGSPSYLVYLVPKDRHGKSSLPWQDRGGIVLETKWTRQSLRSSDRLPRFLEIFNGVAEPVGRTLVDNIHHGFPIHRMPEYSTSNPSRRGGFGLYYYKGFFGVPRKGPYTFATASRWDSYIVVDDKLVASWPGKHDIHQGRRGEKQGNISLEPGIHKLEYFNCCQWGQMSTVAAWKRPNEQLRVMTPADFVPVGRYRATSAGFNDPDKVYAAFEWSAIDDFRLEQTGSAFVTMRFNALKPQGPGDHSYRWTFDDGTVATGQIVDHVFLRSALRKVKFEVLLNDKFLAQANQDVYVHPPWDKFRADSSNVALFDKVIQERNLDKVPVEDLINLFTLADGADRPDWKARATTTLIKGLDRLVEESDNMNFFLDFGLYLRSTELRKYDLAFKLFSGLQEKPGLDASVRRRAAIHRAEILTEYFGGNQEALKILDQLGIRSPARGELIRRAIITRAETMLALGQAKEAIELVQQLSELSEPAGEVTGEIKHTGLIRRARLLVQNKDDQDRLDDAMANIETIIAEDPLKIFSPNVNLIRLDIHLARKEFQIAFHLTERLTNLQLNDYDRAEILARQVIAMCGLKDVENAKSVYTQLSKDYPYSPAVAEAQKAIVQTFGRQ